MSQRLLNLLLIIPATLASAATVTASPLDSSAFAYKYEADDFPTNATPAWGVENSRLASNSLGGGVYSQSTNTTDGRTGSLSFVMEDGAGSDWDVQAGVGYTVEMKIRVVSAGGTVNRDGVWFDVADGTNSAGIRILDASIQETSIDNQNSFTTAAANQNNWQVYRLVVSDDHATFDVYLNNVLIQNDLNTYALAADRIRWGDPTSTAGTTDNTFDIDYIRWDTTGAYEPIPEPASLGLLAIGAATLVTRRRRRP